MHDIDMLISRIAGRHHGVVTRRQLIASTVSQREIDARVAVGTLVGVHPGVYRHVAVPLTRESIYLGALRACGPQAAISHRSAAQLHGLKEVPRAAPEVTVLGSARARPRGVIVHRTTALDAVDLTTVDGIRTTSIARTLLGVCAVLPLHVAKTAIQVAVIDKRVTDVQLVCVLERLGRRGRGGTATLRQIVASEIPPAELQSRLELDLFGLILDTVDEPPILQLRIEIDGEVFFIDFAWPDRKIAVEADGRRWHSTEADYKRGLRRRALLASLGWLVLPYGWSDVHEEPGVVRSTLRRTFTASAA